MKKLIALLLALVMCFAMFAFGDDDTKGKDDDNDEIAELEEEIENLEDEIAELKDKLEAAIEDEDEELIEELETEIEEKEDELKDLEKELEELESEDEDEDEDESSKTSPAADIETAAYNYIAAGKSGDIDIIFNIMTDPLLRKHYANMGIDTDFLKSMMEDTYAEPNEDEECTVGASRYLSDEEVADVLDAANADLGYELYTTDNVSAIGYVWLYSNIAPDVEIPFMMIDGEWYFCTFLVDAMG